MQEQARHDTQYASFLNAATSGKRPDMIVRAGFLYHVQRGLSRLYIPVGSLRARLLHEAHDMAISGHLGRDKTLERLQRSYFWPKMAASVHDYVRTCPSCQSNKASNQLPIGLLKPLPIPQHKWDHVSLDLITQLPTTLSGHDAIIVFVDKLTKMIHAVPTVTTVTAPETARLFFDTVFRLHGLPTVIRSDRDPRFTSDFWTALFKLTGTRLAMSTANHPQTDGQTERANRTLEEMLRAYVSPHHSDWDKHLTAVEFAYNDSVHAGTGYTPFFLNAGQHPHTPLSLAAQPPAAARHEPGEQFAERMAAHIKHARHCLERAQQRMKKNADLKRRDHHFRVGDQVLLLASHFTHSRPSNVVAGNSSRKLAPRAYGPFKVLELVSDGTALRLSLPATWSRLHPVIHVSHVRPFLDSGNQYPDRIAPLPPPPQLEDGEEFFVVNALVNHRSVRNKLEYLVRWLGYDSHENTWRPATQLRADLGDAIFDQLLAEYRTTPQTTPAKTLKIVQPPSPDQQAKRPSKRGLRSSDI